MPRIRTITYEQADPAAREIFDHYKKERGNMPNMFRTVAYRPEILRTMIAHFRAVMETGTVGIKLKELVAVRTSQINHCDYCLDSHNHARASTMAGPRSSLPTWPTSAPAPISIRAKKPPWNWPSARPSTPTDVDDEFWAGLREHFDEGEIIELAAVIGLFNYFNRFNNALKMEPTK